MMRELVIVALLLLGVLVARLALGVGAALALAVTLLGCGDVPGTTLGERVYAAVEGAWYEHPGNLPAIRDGGSCGRLSLLEVRVPASEAEYHGYCPRESNGCLRWWDLEGRVRTLSVPVAWMHPRVSADRWAALAVHELLHAVTGCAGLGLQYQHEDPRVWRPAADSVEAMAVAELYGD